MLMLLMYKKNFSVHSLFMMQYMYSSFFTSKRKKLVIISCNIFLAKKKYTDTNCILMQLEKKVS